MAFILVQHLDPTHESMMVDLLASRTAMTVRQAADGMLIEREHLYIIPPGTYLSVGTGALHLTPPQVRHGRVCRSTSCCTRWQRIRERAICVILSGTGADGSLGLKAVKESGGLVIAQDPDDSGYDGMPRNAIATAAVDLVLPVAKIPEALAEHDRHMTPTFTRNGLHEQNTARNWLPEIIELLRTKTVHDFRLYKSGTLQRRIERRMAMAAIETDDMDRYLAILRTDANELDQLTKDRLINVTSFFRDTKVFDVPDADRIVGQVAADHFRDRSSGPQGSGEETYSLAMLFLEAISAEQRNVKLQVFASDIDADAWRLPGMDVTRRQSRRMCRRPGSPATS